MRKILASLALAIIGVLCGPALHAQGRLKLAIYSLVPPSQLPANGIVYELACPTGYEPLRYAVSYDQTTGNYRAYGCLQPSTGLITWQPDAVVNITTVTTNNFTCGTIPGAACNVTPLVVNTGGFDAQGPEVAQILGNLQVTGYTAGGLGPHLTTLTINGASGSQTVFYAAYEFCGSNYPFCRSTDSEKSTSSGPSTISATNSITVSGTCGSPYDYIRVQRIISTSPSSTGYIGSAIPCSASKTWSLTDTGLAGDGTSFTSGDSSGLIEGVGLISRNSPYVGFFTPDSGAVTNSAGIGTFNANSNNPFTSIFSCSSTGCTGNQALVNVGPATFDSSVLIKGAVSFSGGSAFLRLSTFTVGSLPSASGAGAGAIAMVTDATTTTIGACVGGGSTRMIAVSDGTSWTCH